jgi:hypothetical protein
MSGLRKSAAWRYGNVNAIQDAHVMPLNLRRLLLVLPVIACLPGCTTRAWYEGMQNSAKAACRQQPSSEQARCEARLNQQDYDIYEKNRIGPK